MSRLGTLALALALMGPASASAATKVVRDDKGRAITFDVRAGGVDVRDYARVLRNAIHGNEITDVRIRIVPPAQIRRHCGSGASACFRGARGKDLIVVPAGKGTQVARTLLHEYAHHIDNVLDHGRRLREPNGTPRWWRARRIAERLRTGKVAFDCGRGWTRSIGEIFSEDYVALHMRTTHQIDWIPAPNATVRRALRTDLKALGRLTTPRAPIPDDTPRRPPVEATDVGVLAAGELDRIPFGLLGPGRHVRVDVSVDGLDGVPARVGVSVVCDGTELDAAEAASDNPAALDITDAGPGRCQVQLTGIEGQARYHSTLTLSVGESAER